MELTIWILAVITSALVGMLGLSLWVDRSRERLIDVLRELIASLEGENDVLRDFVVKE